MKCIIADDDRTSRFIISSLINKTGKAKIVAECQNALEVIEAVEKYELDLLFLDIEMPEMSGIDLLNRLSKKVPTIFITSQARYAPSAFDIDAVDFLVKPIIYSRLLVAIQRAERIIVNPIKKALIQNKNAQDFLFIKGKTKLEKINFNSIEYLKSDGPRVAIYCNYGLYKTYTSIKKIKEKLDNRFIESFRGYIINSNKISSFQGNTIVINNVELPINNKAKKEIMKRLQNE